MSEYKKEINTSKYMASHILSLIDTSNTILELNEHPQYHKKTKSCAKLCKNYLRGDSCKWHRKGKCKYAHGFLDLDKHSQMKVLELGIQSFIYMYQDKSYSFTYSIFDFIDSMKLTEKLYLQELFHVQETKNQYFDLHKHFTNLHKELIFLRNVSDTHINNKIENLNFTNKSTIVKKINEMKNVLEDTVVCNICCSSIINTEDLDKMESTSTYVENSNKFVTLTCGHSICNLCHFRIVSNENSIYINCPVCREKNELSKSKPNYTLNESIFKLKMVYNQFTNIASDIDKYIVNSNKERFYTKNVKDILKLSNEKDKDKETLTHIDLKYKCFECPF